MGTSASFARKALSCLAAALLASTLVPASALAGEDIAEPSVEEPQEANSAQADKAVGASSEADGSTSADSSVEAGTLAASLMGRPASFVNADVVLDGEPIIGSFTVDGLTFAVVDESTVELVGISNPEAIGSAPVASETEVEADAPTLLLPKFAAYGDVEYSVTSIGAYAFYLSGVTSVGLPATVVDVDDRAFRSSDIASVTVAEGNPSYSSFDGALYSADQSSLLLIPEGKQGAVLLPKETEVAEAGKFSHCSLVDAISVEDGVAFASENGLLYTSDLTTLLRVPAGATEITIREGCTTIAAGAMEGCAQLATINAPASVTSISPDVFTSVPTISLPAATLAEDAPQLTALVAFSSTDDELPEVNPAAIGVSQSAFVGSGCWAALGMVALEMSGEPSFEEERESQASMQTAESYTAFALSIYTSTPAVLTFNPRKNPGDVVNGASFTRAASLDSPYVVRGTTKWLPQGAHYDYIQIWYGDMVWYNTFITADGYYIEGQYSGPAMSASQKLTLTGAYTSSAVYVKLLPYTYDISYDLGDNATQAGNPTTYTIEDTFTLAAPVRPGYSFRGWSGTGIDGISRDVTISRQTGARSYTAHWNRVDFDLGFDVDSEPGDEDYPGIEKPDETINVDDGPAVIEDPKRPGYVFQGWVIPSDDGTEAIDQDLVYQDESDGKWYVDASKLPDYANDEGRVELTARWTSVISVDVPSAATFYYDLVTDQSGEAHEAALSGTTSFSSQSQVDLRVCGLESVKASGADALFSSGADSALLSVYPAADGSATTVEDAQGPAGEKPSTAVDFSLDDIVLEAAFAKAGADAFSIPAGDDLTLSYRLNLGDGASLDYDKVLAMAEGDEASLASITYCFAANYDSPADWGEPLWIENPDTSEGAPRFLVLDDIKAAAEDLSTNGTSSVYYDMYKGMLDRQVMSNGNPGEGPYFQLRVDGVYLPVQLIGICQDTKSDGAGKAGLTFQMRDIYAYGNVRSAAAGGGVFNTYMNPSPNTNAGGWKNTAMRSALRSTFWGYLPKGVQSAIVLVDKYQQMPGGTNASKLDKTTSETIWLPSMYEVFGISFAEHNEAEALTSVAGYEPFQYMAFQPGGTGDTNIKATKAYNGFTAFWGLRSARRYDTVSFCRVDSNGSGGSNGADSTWGSVPCFCL